MNRAEAVRTIRETLADNGVPTGDLADGQVVAILNAVYSLDPRIPAAFEESEPEHDRRFMAWCMGDNDARWRPRFA